MLNELFSIAAKGQGEISKNPAIMVRAHPSEAGDRWNELLQEFNARGISSSMAVDHKAFIEEWLNRAVDEGKLQETARLSSRKLGNQLHSGPGAPAVVNPFLDGGSSSSLPVSELENVSKQLAATPLTILARLVAVNTLVTSYRHESFERDHRSEAGRACLDKATLLLEEVLSAAEQSEVTEDARIPRLTAMCNLGILYRDKREYLTAMEVMKSVCEGLDDILGSRAEQTLHAGFVLAGVHELVGEIDEAEMLYLELLDVAQHHLGRRADLTLRIMVAIARCLANNWRADEVESVLQEAYSRSIHANGAVSGFTAGIAHQLGVCYSRQGKLEEAITMFSTSRDVLSKMYGYNDPGTTASARMLGNTFFKLQSFQDARDSWAVAISGHHALGTLQTPLGVSLLQDCLALGQELGHVNSYSWKIRRDPLGFLKTLGLDIDKSPINVIGRTSQTKPPATSLPYMQRNPPDSRYDVEKQPLTVDPVRANDDDDYIAAVASISGTGAYEFPDWSPRWLDSHDPEFSAANILHAAGDWTLPCLQGLPEAPQTSLGGSLDFVDTDRGGPPHQVVEAFRMVLCSLPQMQFRETNSGFRCMWNYCVVVDVTFVKVLVTGVYGLQFRKRGSAIRHGDPYYGLWMRVWDNVLSRRVTESLQQLRRGTSESRLRGVQSFLRDRLKKVALEPSV